MRTVAGEVKFTRVSTAVAAGVTTVNSTGVDMLSTNAGAFNGVAFIASIGAVVAGAVTSAKLQSSDDDSTYTDIPGTSVTILDTDDEKFVLMDVVRPPGRYVRCVILRATQNATIYTIIAMQYMPLKAPVNHGAGIIGSTLVTF